MDAVKNDVKRLVKIELAAANRKFGCLQVTTRAWL